MSVQTFYNPSLVEKLRRVGIGVGVRRQLPSGTTQASPGPRTALELVEDNARLRAEIDQLRRDKQHLSDEVARLRGETPRAVATESDDAAARFALLELDL
jgi:hypothetical protein